VEQTSKTPVSRTFIWIAAAGVLVLILVVAISETRARRDAVRARNAEQPALAGDNR